MYRADNNMDENKIKKLIKEEVSLSFSKRIGDTPTDALQLVPLKFVSAVSVLGAAGVVILNPFKGNVFTITPAAAVQLTVSDFRKKGIFTLVVKTSGTTSYVIDFQTGFTTTATLATGTLDGRYFVVTFVCDGVGFREVARTAAMLPY